jgi:hypothetical protein
MAEHDRNRVDEAQDAVRERNIVRDGGIARSDADIEDVSRDTYSTPITAADDNREATDEDRTLAREVLGIARDVTPDPNFAVGDSESTGRRRTDDMSDGRTRPDPDSTGSSYEGPDGLKVRD